jgi:endonuclease YncB( thermonuclease family)
MRRLFPVLWLLFPVLVGATPSGNVLTGRVVRVSDGDSITILTADQVRESVRLYGIDAPEQRGGQPFWRVSRDRLAALVAGQTVEVSWDRRDPHGRIVGWVRDSDGTEVNLVMVQVGLAWWFESAAGGNARFREAQEAARDKRIGLWAKAGAIEPWEWRRGRRAP